MYADGRMDVVHETVVSRKSVGAHIGEQLLGVQQWGVGVVGQPLQPLVHLIEHPQGANVQVLCPGIVAPSLLHFAQAIEATRHSVDEQSVLAVGQFCCPVGVQSFFRTVLV